MTATGNSTNADRELANSISITLEPLRNLAALADEWRALERRADHSFFVSWGWIGCWLRQIPASMALQLLRATVAGRTVALGIIVARMSWRRGIIRSRGLHLHETGDRNFDGLTIEHNGLLLDRQAGFPVEARCLDFLLRGAADEVHLSGIDSKRLAAIQGLGLRWRLRDRKPQYSIDLVRLRECGSGLAGAVNGHTRRQLRRSRRWYEEKGAIQIVAAVDADDALHILDELKDLHQRQWRARGQPGAFASSFFERFHRDLIRDRFAAGEIQVLRIAAGSSVIGCLYNFLYAGRVYYYQSGFAYPSHQAIQPGLVCHALAVEWNIDRGAAIYDLLAGNSRFKRSIATDRGEMLWLSIQQDRLRFKAEEGLLRLKALLVGQVTGQALTGLPNRQALLAERQ